MSLSFLAVVFLLLCGAQAQDGGAHYLSKSDADHPQLLDQDPERSLENNFYGTVITYYLRDQYANGTQMVRTYQDYL